MTTKTRSYRFVGQNIKGTPAMPARHVAHDLRVLQAHADVAVLQEFKWPWYWRTLIGTLGKMWQAFPAEKHGLAHPIRGAQAIVWRAALLTRTGSHAQLLHSGRAGWSDDRMLRAAELTDRATGLAGLFGTTHFVVNGDKASDKPVGHAMMGEDLDHFNAFLDELVATGHPIMWELDANIAVGSQAWPRFQSIVRAHGGQFHGHLGVEYLFTIPGKTTRFEVTEVWQIPTSDLFTDHEGRGVTFQLVATT